jgi:hypothetical protein
MRKQIDLECWEAFEDLLPTLVVSRPGSPSSANDELLFRGQASSDWRLETTLERSRTNINRISQYFYFLSAAKPQLETFTGRRWPDLDFIEIDVVLSNYDRFELSAFPAYELCVYSRHHGFPSPLLDWSKSPYIAAYFAFAEPKKDRIAIWAYQEYAEVGKNRSSNEPHIRRLGPYVTSHPRHFLQQGQYTIAAQFNDGRWHLTSHHEVFELDREDQDLLTKVTLPASEQSKVLNLLDRYNINAYSLMQSEDALLQTIAFRLLPRYR